MVAGVSSPPSLESNRHQTLAAAPGCQGRSSERKTTRSVVSQFRLIGTPFKVASSGSAVGQATE
jgi:hypothetical protein